MNSFLKFFLVGFVAGPLALAFIAFASADTNIDPGECTTIDLVGNATEVVCANNATIADVFIVLDPGEREENDRPEGFTVHAECTDNDANDAPVCSKNRLLDPGEEWSLHDGACDLEFECKEIPEDYCTSGDEVYDHLSKGVFEKKDDNIILRIDDEEVINLPVPQNALNIDFDIPISCPVALSEEDISSMSDDSLLRVINIVDWAFAAAVNNSINADKNWKDDFVKNNEQLISCLSDKNSADSKYNELESSKNSLVAELRAQNNVTNSKLYDCQKKTIDLEASNQSKSGGLFALTTVSILLSFYAIFITREYVRSKRGDA